MSANADKPISDYGVIGNCRTIALVAKDGSIDWYCWPRIDSPAAFCRLLDADRGGFLRIGPTAPYRVRRAYEEDTNILETRFEVDGTGEVALVDFMPALEPHGDGPRAHWLVRQIRGLSGEVDIEVRFKPTHDFLRGRVELQRAPGGAVARADGLSFALVSPAPLDDGGPGELAGRMKIRAGQTRWVVLSAGRDVRSGALGVPDDALQRALDETRRFWRAWTARGNQHGPQPEAVKRSALVLKLLIYAPTGALAAAGTTSLPEDPGGVRNWDYRLTWIRDSALALYSLQQLGYREEAASFWEWVAERALESREPQILYAVDGSRDVHEQELHHLRGWRDSRPVRIGNAAENQHQEDVYGEILDAAASCEPDVADPHGPHYWKIVRQMADHACETWRKPGHGLWEVRTDPRHFVQAKVMCWVGLERAAKIADDLGERDGARWRKAAEEIRAQILERGYNRKLGAFTQELGGDALDASVLLMPIVGFIDARDPRMRSTVDRVQEQLGEDGLLRRYRTDDGLPGHEGLFLPCSFWLVDNLALQGRVAEARALFERVSGCANDLGLLSEELDGATGELLGNFPQAFSHLALIRSAVLIEEAMERGEGRAC